MAKSGSAIVNAMAYESEYAQNGGLLRSLRDTMAARPCAESQPKS